MSYEIYSILLAVLLVLGCLQLICWRRLNRSISHLETELAAVKQQLQAVTSGALGVGRRLQQTEARLAQALDRQNRIEQKDSASLPYTQAGKLLRMGASVEEVMEACGLSRAEASLVELLNRSEPRRR